jgi:hypothetical protein
LEVGITGHNFGRGLSKDHSTKSLVQIGPVASDVHLLVELLLHVTKIKYSMYVCIMFKIIAFFATRLFVPVMSEDWHFTSIPLLCINLSNDSPQLSISSCVGLEKDNN